MSKGRTVAVAMSGGVDSSVAASLLVDAGERVFGLMLRLWSAGPQQPNRCCSPKDMANARRVAGQLGIPFYVVDAKDEFKNRVVDPFVAGYSEGITPNPCMACNREIRWGLLLEHARQLGATHLATGHYAQALRKNGRYHLYRAADRRKDQSYVLSVLGQQELARSLFPLGKHAKEEVRRIARRLDLVTADRPESQDLCFLGGSDYRSFLAEHTRSEGTTGPIEDHSGVQLGWHRGLRNYTIGQRRGIGVSASKPLYVLAKNLERNALVVGTREHLGTDMFSVERVSWVSGIAPTEGSSASVQVRYRASAIPARLFPGPDGVEVRAEEPIPQVTPGQAAVFYSGEECLGGGLIPQ